MYDKLVVAAVQMNSTLDRAANRATAERLVEQAARDGATLIALPELFNGLGPYREVAAAAEPIPGPTSQWLASLACRLGVTLLGGSIAERMTDSNLVYNTSLLFNAEGKLFATYRKQHLFDVALPGVTPIRESDYFRAGEADIVVTEKGGNIGVAICYDLRFPELFRRLASQGLELLLLPSAFTLPTGRAHWEVLLRARAIENQAFVVAPNQCGAHGGELATYGHSAIIGPWGEVLAMASENREEVIQAELSGETLRVARAKVPALLHRRT